MPCHMICAHCKASVTLEGPKEYVWTAFCGPEHCKAWQDARTEGEIRQVASAPNGADDRCQWCNCKLCKGYHEDGCPVRALAERTSDV